MGDHQGLSNRDLCAFLGKGWEPALVIVWLGSLGAAAPDPSVATRCRIWAASTDGLFLLGFESAAPREVGLWC